MKKILAAVSLTTLVESSQVNDVSENAEALYLQAGEKYIAATEPALHYPEVRHLLETALEKPNTISAEANTLMGQTYLDEAVQYDNVAYLNIAKGYFSKSLEIKPTSDANYYMAMVSMKLPTSPSFTSVQKFMLTKLFLIQALVLNPENQEAKTAFVQLDKALDQMGIKNQIDQIIEGLS